MDSLCQIIDWMVTVSTMAWPTITLAMWSHSTKHGTVMLWKVRAYLKATDIHAKKKQQTSISFCQERKSIEDLRRPIHTDENSISIFRVKKNKFENNGKKNHRRIVLRDCSKKIAVSSLVGRQIIITSSRTFHGTIVMLFFSIFISILRFMVFLRLPLSEPNLFDVFCYFN